MTVDYKNSELMAVCVSRGVKDGDVVLVGIGLPYVGAVLAQHTHAPNLFSLAELGCFQSLPIDTSVGPADPRSWYGATRFSGFMDTVGYIVHGRRCDVGMLGAAEIDQYGNMNSTQVYANGKVKHINGSGGANDTASSAFKTIAVQKHEKRKLRDQIDYITSPGFLQGGNSKEEAGIRGGGLAILVTDKAVFAPDKNGRMTLQSIHPGVDREALKADTGFEIDVDGVPETPVPTEEEIRLIREVVDPKGIYT